MVQRLRSSSLFTIGKSRRRSITAPPKPSAQTQLLLDEMARRASDRDERWDEVQESLDLIFAKMTTFDNNQKQMKAQLDLNSQVVDQAVRDQITLSKQITETGRVVARLALERDKEPAFDEEGSVASTERAQGNNFSNHNCQNRTEHEDTHLHRPSARRSVGQSDKSYRHHLPKMNFPVFDGSNPKIWIDKCRDYFTIFNIPSVLWVSAASMNFDGNASKWLQAYKPKHELGNWEQFTAAVEEKFGTYDYRQAMTTLMGLK